MVTMINGQFFTLEDRIEAPCALERVAEMNAADRAFAQARDAR